jgi:hypothetical protein
MIHYKGEERILYLKINGEFLPIGCLSENSFSETAESFETTIKGEASWKTDRILSQSYTLSFSGIQILTKFLNTDFLSYDTLKDLKRRRQLLEWKIDGDNFPIVDSGYCYITDISESAVVNELLTFSGTLTGFGEPRIGLGNISNVQLIEILSENLEAIRKICSNESFILEINSDIIYIVQE